MKGETSISEYSFLRLGVLQYILAKCRIYSRSRPRKMLLLEFICLGIWNLGTFKHVRDILAMGYHLGKLLVRSEDARCREKLDLSSMKCEGRMQWPSASNWLRSIVNCTSCSQPTAE